MAGVLKARSFFMGWILSSWEPTALNFCLGNPLLIWLKILSKKKKINKPLKIFQRQCK
jgi:hypothetical protein